MKARLKKDIKLIGACGTSKWEMSNDYIFTDGEEYGETPIIKDGKKMFFPLKEYNLFNVLFSEEHFDIENS